MAHPGLAALRSRVQRVQFIVGLGFLSAVLGAFLAVPLQMKLGQKLGPQTSLWTFLLADFFLGQLWVYLVLPVLAYGAARVIALKPVPTAVGAAATGTAFYLAIALVTAGLDGLQSAWLVWLVRLAGLGLGVALTVAAVRTARRQAELTERQAAHKARDRKGEYDEFLKEAERVSSLPHQAPGAGVSTETQAPLEGEVESPSPSEPLPPRQ